MKVSQPGQTQSSDWSNLLGVSEENDTQILYFYLQRVLVFVILLIIIIHNRNTSGWPHDVSVYNRQDSFLEYSTGTNQPRDISFSGRFIFYIGYWLPCHCVQIKCYLYSPFYKQCRRGLHTPIELHQPKPSRKTKKTIRKTFKKAWEEQQVKKALLLAASHRDTKFVF